MFQNLNEKMQVYTCIFDIEVDGQAQRESLQAPRIMLEQHFMGIVQQAMNLDKPAKIKMSLNVPIYNNFTNSWIEREHSCTFTNNAYLNKEKE